MTEKSNSDEQALEVLRCLCHGINLQVQQGDDRLPSVFLVPAESCYRVGVYEWVVQENGKGKPSKYPLKTSIELRDLPGYLAALKKSDEAMKNWVDEF